MQWESALPFGLADLSQEVTGRSTTTLGRTFYRGNKMRCPVAHCDHFIEPSSRGRHRETCPAHNISVSRSPTYIYAESHVTENLIVGRGVFQEIKKAERGRMGHENSEDALTWNTFVGLLALGTLNEVFRQFTGIVVESNEIELIIWGNRISASGIEPWMQLAQLQRRLEPLHRQGTEPDVILRLPGRAIVLVEAKFGSANSYLAKARISEYLQRYVSRHGKADPLNRLWIAEQGDRVILGQLMRNVIFAHWLAGEGERPFVVNLLREKSLGDSGSTFAQHLNSGTVEYGVRTWESLIAPPILQGERGRSLYRYMSDKTYSLRRAFEMPAGGH